MHCASFPHRALAMHLAPDLQNSLLFQCWTSWAERESHQFVIVVTLVTWLDQLPIRTKITESLCNWPEQHLKFHFERNILPLAALNKTSLLIHFKNEDRCSSANSTGRGPQGQDKGNWDAFIKHQISRMRKVSFSEILSKSTEENKQDPSTC